MADIGPSACAADAAASNAAATHRSIARAAIVSPRHAAQGR
jgi:hypothetical protein